MLVLQQRIKRMEDTMTTTEKFMNIINRESNAEGFLTLGLNPKALSNLKPSGTMKAWFKSHDGSLVSTLQVSSSGGWMPGQRLVDASRATYVTMDGSRRDYAGMKVLHSTSDLLVVEDDHATIAYWLAPTKNS